ncbi:hypothetical protein THAOC_07366, partial [Thalassiosira oceanica]
RLSCLSYVIGDDATSVAVLYSWSLTEVASCKEDTARGAAGNISGGVCRGGVWGLRGLDRDAEGQECAGFDGFAPLGQGGTAGNGPFDQRPPGTDDGVPGLAKEGYACPAG